MQVKISEFLKEFTSELPESVLGGEIFKLTYTENLENIRFHVHFDELVPSDDIFVFEKAVEAAIKVEQVRLAPRYPSEKFGMDCYGELVKLLKRDIPVVNGFLDDAEVSLGNGELRIKIVHGGRDILDRYNFCIYFSRLIYNQFGVRVKVALDGESNVSEQQFDEMIERLEAEDTSAKLSGSSHFTNSADVSQMRSRGAEASAYAPSSIARFATPGAANLASSGRTGTTRGLRRRILLCFRPLPPPSPRAPAKRPPFQARRSSTAATAKPRCGSRTCASPSTPRRANCARWTASRSRSRRARRSGSWASPAAASP